ncbi:Protein NRT1/ PTR FAMILY 8.1 [Striga hermonthica]|uniref:Protein NRT1/ PTR FAMILY 8.1 n=1 Tax=Striga hermonthica TaxID=68872 RepID=A0A9N7P2Q5_STRHE|nr:Protein NRT1/ PTR FAMILY 8.1 [Striga hermonthica]
MSSNLVVYFKERLNQHSATASNNVSNWSGTCYITPLIGAFLADAYLGRYWTIACFSIIYLIGTTMLTLSASIPGLKPTSHGPTTTQSAACFTSLYLIAVGTGGIKPPYVDPNQCGLAAGFGIPAASMVVAVAIFFSGTRLYRNQRLEGSPLVRLCQVLVASCRKCGVRVPDDVSLLYETLDVESTVRGSRKLRHINDLRFFDKAAVKTQSSSDHETGPVNPWLLCTVTQVEELKAIVRLLPVWATGIVFSVVYSQISTLFVLQGLTMNPHLVRGSTFRIPAASLSIFDTLSIIFWVPIYDRLIVPAARKLTGRTNGLTQLQRIGTGLFISIFAMLSAGALEFVRLGYVRRHNAYQMLEVPMSILWQVPQYFLVGCAEVFVFVGQLEFFYEQAPDSMRSLCSALQLTMVGLGSYLSTLLVSSRVGWIPDNLNYGHLDYFYWLMAGLSVVNLGVFMVVARWYTYKKPVGFLWWWPGVTLTSADQFLCMHALHGPGSL